MDLHIQADAAFIATLLPEPPKFHAFDPANCQNCAAMCKPCVPHYRELNRREECQRWFQRSQPQPQN